MKVLVFTSQFHQVGGSERLSVELAIELNRIGLRADLLSQYSGELPNVLEAESQLKASGIPKISYLGLGVKPRVGALIVSIFRFRSLLKINGYDAVEVSGFTPSLIASLGALGTGKKILFGVHAQYHRSRNNGIRYYLWRNILKYSKHVDYYAISQSVAQDWIGYTKTHSKRTAVILNSINNRFYAVNSFINIRKVIRNRMAISTDSVLILFVGRLVKSKGIDTIYEAAKIILEKNENYHFIFVGRADDSEGPNDAVLLQSIKREVNYAPWGQRVHFLGECSEVPELMAACDLLVHPARLEGFGLTLAEALASGLRVVASNVGGIPEVLEGTDSVMIAPDDSNALAGAISSALAWSSEKVEAAITLGKQRADSFRVEIRARSIMNLLTS